jgi:hypothetical protein
MDLFTNLVCTAKKTQHYIIAKINWLMLFQEIISIYNENHTKPINTKYSVKIVKDAGICSHH